MLDVKTGQIWKIRSRGNGEWRRAYVVDVLGDIVELEYLDVGGVFDMHQTLTTTRSAMLLTAANYQFVDRATAGSIPRKRHHASARQQHRSSS
jgi:hypothetical protein